MLRKLFLLTFLALLIFSCARSPIVHRTQFIILTHQQEMELGNQAAKAILKREKLVKNPKLVERVKRVFEKLYKALPDKYKKLYDWKVYVLDNPQVNAFALPNGNIFVYKGLLDFVKSDDELAAVLAHEMAHVILRHGAEKNSTYEVASLGEYLLLGKLSPAYRQIGSLLYEAGVSIAFLLPYSREQEREADEVGLLIMQRAGFNLDGAVKLWERMTKKFAKEEPPEFLSDHPLSKERLEYVRKLVSFLKKHPEYAKKFVLPKLENS